MRAGLALAALLGAAPPALGQQADGDAHAAEMIETARHYYGVARSVGGCRAATDPDEIVVCARRRPDPRYEPPPPPLPQDAKAIALGAPPMGGGAGVGVSVRGCFLQKCPRPLYFIDVSALPQAPPGSDAERIAKGEMPAR